MPTTSTPPASSARSARSPARTRCSSRSTREIYKHLERIVDAFEDVANEIDGIVIDHA